MNSTVDPAAAATAPAAAPRRPTFDERVARDGRVGLYAARVRTIQVNVGLRCNQTCLHCHVNSSPFRKEEMSWETMEQVLAAVRATRAQEVDITGGAPEMHPHLRRFIGESLALGAQVMVRTNLTILVEPGYEDYPEFFRDHGVMLIASLPCYLEDNVDRQRGDGVFQGSIAALRRLNEVGYGRDEALPLSLVYNPVGPHLPPNQAELEATYRQRLADEFGIEFTRLLTITNMPIGRFRVDLRQAGREQRYADKLLRTFNPATVDGLMCRHQVSVRWDGTLFDCDFNLALRLPTVHGVPRHISEFDAAALGGRRIATAAHCFGCTAGAGSSCGGALV